ncbi:hypothetical protein JRQ81_006083 [Phrynocephalus forsythii]|uniref:Uncharacterized protein n=1 Tax=Phrynocephalus forsythii TaxID=171643 RepID=A0A9Q1AVS4_9SAUR|nr:hypothetical protein JRQ81_006083 [Phrynocephalus forsythii]
MHGGDCSCMAPLIAPGVVGRYGRTGVFGLQLRGWVGSEGPLLVHHGKGFPFIELNMISQMEQKEELDASGQNLHQGSEEKKSMRDAHHDEGTTSENEEWEEEEELEEEGPVASDGPDAENPSVIAPLVLDWQEACETLQAGSLLVTWVALIHIVSPESDSYVSDAIIRTYNLACLMQANSTVLLNAYLSHQGRPFSNPGFFATQQLQYNGVPTIAIDFLEWRTMTDLGRLNQNYRAYSAFSVLLQLIRDDLLGIKPQETELLEMLRVTRVQIQGLLSNLTSIMSSLGAPPTTLSDLPILEVLEADTFKKKLWASLVCYRYKQWVSRTVRDFSLLREKYAS